MLDASARLLRMLSLLQARRDWAGPELAERLGVTPRTVRRDVDKLRALGYPVSASTGTNGGYRLGAGAAMPPLQLDDEEAVAVAVGLRSAAGGTVTGIEETSLRALAKLEQVQPARLRHRVSVLQSMTVPMAGKLATVDADTLTLIAAACRDHERLRFDYRKYDDIAARREVEPHRLVHSWAGIWTAMTGATSVSTAWSRKSRWGRASFREILRATRKWLRRCHGRSRPAVTATRVAFGCMPPLRLSLIA